MLSILMPVYNRERYIVSAIMSCVGQLRSENCRIIVCDDGSFDETPAILDDLQKSIPNLQVVTHITNKGISAARNTLLEALPPSTRYVAFMDSDDVYVEDALTKCIDHLEKSPDLMMVLGQRQVVHTSALENCTRPNHDWPIVIGCTLCSGVYRAELITAVGSFDLSFSQSEDIDYLIRMAELSDSRKLIKDVIYFQRRHGKNITRNINDVKTNLMRALLFHAKRRSLDPTLKDVKGLFPSMNKNVAIQAQLIDEEFCE